MNDLKRLNHLVSELDHAFHELSLKQGLSDSASSILYTLWDCGGSCPLTQILRCTGIPKQTVNSALRKLEQEGTVYLTNNEGRKKKVCLTEEGTVLAKNTVGQTFQMENEILDSWTQEERTVYLMLTNRYLEQLKEKVKELYK